MENRKRRERERKKKENNKFPQLLLGYPLLFTLVANECFKVT